jgi:poly(A) polymerase
MSEPAIAKEHIDLDAQKVIRHLVRNGYQAYLVGGCVRDLLLGRTPKDFDLATSATPSEVRDLFRNCRIIGRRFRLAHVVFGRKIIETATFRANPREEEAEGEGTPGELYIHRDNVFGTAEEDARRRDFTMNGLFYDVEPGQVIDYVGGLHDIKQRSVRTIGDPNIRFREDPVRLLRAVKFAARLGFDIEDQTYRAMITHRADLQKSAVPRVLEEIYRLLRGGAAVESLVLLREVGLLTELLPELAGRLEAQPQTLEPYLHLVDQGVAAGEVPSAGLLLVLLFAAELQPLFDEESAARTRDPLALVDSVLGPLCARLRVARRDVERAKLLLLAQRRLFQVRRKGGKLPASLQHREGFSEALALHGLLYRVARQAEGAEPPQIEAEMSAWPLPRTSLLGTQDGEAGEGRRPAGESAERSPDHAGDRSGDRSGDRPGGRRRRRGPSAEDAANRDLAASHFSRGSLDDDEPVPDEDAVIAAFTAALGSRSADDE